MHSAKRSLAVHVVAAASATIAVLLAVGAEAAPRSLVIDHNGSGDVLAFDLLATGLFDDVTHRSGTLGVPTLDELIPYDSILYYTNMSQPDPVGFGDVLADYVDAGGHLVMATYSFGGTTTSVQGRIITTGYTPLTTSTTSNGIVSGDVLPVDPNDSVFEGVDLGTITFSVNSSYPRPDLDVGATLLATDAAGRKMIARNASGNVIAVNVFPRPIEMNVEGDRLFANALQVATSEPICIPSHGFSPLILVSTDGPPVPGTPREFSSFGAPALVHGRVAFRGQSAGRQDDGIYIADCAGLHTVADLSTAIPGGAWGTFTGFDDFAFDGARVAFVGLKETDGEPGFFPRRGIYCGDGIAATVDRIAQDQFTVRPMDWSGSNLMEGYWTDLAIDGDTIDFRQRDLSVSADRGFYRWQSGTVLKLFDNAQSLPIGIAPVGFQLGNSHFRHLASQAADPVVYTVDIAREFNINARDEIVIFDDGQTRTQIVRTGDQPIGTTLFSEGLQEIVSVDIDGSHLVFKGLTRGLDQGVYQSIDGSPAELLISEQTRIPGTLEAFDGGIGEVGVDGGWIVFFGQADVVGGLDTLAAIRDGRVRVLVQRGDVVGGKIVSSISFRSEGVHDGKVAYVLGFEDGTRAVAAQSLVVQKVPALSTAGRVGLVALLTLWTERSLGSRRSSSTYRRHVQRETL